MYVTLKPFLVLLALVGAFSYFALKAKILMGLLQAVNRPGPAIDRFPARVREFLLDVVWQRSVRKHKPVVGLAHTGIFWGFIIITLGTIEMMVEGVFHGANLGALSTTFYSYYLMAADIALVAVLAGVGFGFFRRFVLKPAYLTNGVDAKLILLFTAILMLSLLGYNAFRVAAMPTSVLNPYFVVSEPVARLLELGALPPEQVLLGVEVFYWMHLLMVLGFLIYIPNSKHLHILAAAPNIFFRRLDIVKPFPKTDFEAENPAFGMANAKEQSWKGVLDLYACTECGRCEEMCPASMTGKPLSPKRLIHDLKVELLEQRGKVLGQVAGELPPVVRDDSGRITSDVIWACTTCRACEAHCPVAIEQVSPIIEARRNLVQMEARFPAELQTVFKNLENNFTPWAFPADSRADWCRELGVKQMAEHPQAEVLYYVGCAGSFDDRAKKVATAIVKLLKMANVDFAILGKEEKCNGDPARRAGNEYLAQMLIQENVATLNRYKPRKILAACPHCFNTLKNEYPAFGAQYDVVHHSQFLLELVRQGKIKADAKAGETVAYHDSCYMGRWNGVYEAPRDLLKAAGVKVDEVARAKQQGLCCGAGGARMFMEETIGKRVNIERTEELLAKKTKTIAANCPFCTTMLTDGVKAKDKQNDVVIKDIAEILLENARS